MKTTVVTYQEKQRLELNQYMIQFLAKGKKITEVPRGKSGVNPKKLSEDWGYKGGSGHGKWF